VQIPRDWVPLVEDEEIIAVSGQVPKMTCMQWFLSYLSLGVMYFLKYRRRKYTRSALILTTKRLITFDLYERSGSIPATLSNFSVQCRSYVLGKVSSGYIRSLSKYHLEAGIETPAGAICVHFNTHTGDGGGDGGTGRRGMAFALAMQMSVERLKSKVNLDHMLSSKATDKSTDLSMLPLMGGCEKIVDRLQGEKVWEPFFAASGKSLYNQCRAFTTASRLRRRYARVQGSGQLLLAPESRQQQVLRQYSAVWPLPLPALCADLRAAPLPDAQGRHHHRHVDHSLCAHAKFWVLRLLAFLWTHEDWFLH